MTHTGYMVLLVFIISIITLTNHVGYSENSIITTINHEVCAETTIATINHAVYAETTIATTNPVIYSQTRIKHHLKIY